jgi:hypothetical protein
MIVLHTGLFTKEELLDQDICTGGRVPSEDETLIIENPSGMPTYHITKEKIGGKWMYKVAEA